VGLERAFEAANLFGLTPLSARAISARPNPQGLDLVLPATLADIPAPEDRHIAFDLPRRRDLAHKLESALAPLGPHVAVLDAVRSLAEPDATCVLAGQQPGLFGGPLYNCYKALHIAKLARALSARWNKPVVPILWNHADDHDIAEVHHAWFVNPHVDLVKLHLAGTSSGRTPLSRIVCDNERHELSALRARLTDLLADEPEISNELIDLAMPRHGETLACAWTRFHLELFGHLGVVVLEPDWLRAELSEALAELVAPNPLPSLQAGASRLAAAGFDVAIEPAEAALVYRLEDNKRLALRPGGDGWRFDNEPGSRTPSELAAEIVRDKPGYSAGALLRPLVQDLALPVAAYVGGFGELAYHAELGELRRERGVEPGIFVPRASCTLTDARCRAALRQRDQTLGDLVLAPPAPPKPKKTGVKNPVVADLRKTADQCRRALLEHRSALDELDPRLAPQLKHTARRAHHTLEQFISRVERVASNQAGTERRGQRRLETHLLPRGAPQERVLTVLQLVARFGRHWIDELFEALDELPLEHLVAHIDPHTGPHTEPSSS
jgi:bacillithiol biosynthesis cysteine-adding enzyme BshC